MNKTFSCFAFPLNRCASIPSGENESSIRDEVTRTDKFLTKCKRMRVQCTVLRERCNPVTFQFIYIYIWKSRCSFRSVYFPTFLRILKATSRKRKNLDRDSFRSSNVTTSITLCISYIVNKKEGRSGRTEDYWQDSDAETRPKQGNTGKKRGEKDADYAEWKKKTRDV